MSIEDDTVGIAASSRPYGRWSTGECSMTAAPQSRDSAARDRRDHVQRTCFPRCRAPHRRPEVAVVNAPARLGLYGAVLAGMFLASTAAGAAFDPVGLSNAE